MLLQPFVNYNMAGGWYLTCSPIITADWEAGEGDRWTVPVGGGFGRVFKIGKLAINAQIQAYDNVETPQSGADWTLRLRCSSCFRSEGGHAACHWRRAVPTRVRLLAQGIRGLGRLGIDRGAKPRSSPAGS